MKVIVTCGPSFEPIDEVRRLTNSSTGELGALLAERLATACHEVFCLKGSGATHAGPATGPRCHVRRFDTNEDLLSLLREISGAHDIGAVFHAAALCDYRVATVCDASGQACEAPKISSRAGALTIHLEPATKVIHELRALFPRGLLVGWKYELAGTREEALAKAHSQIIESQTNLCVLNGRAAGEGFSVCDPSGELSQWQTKTALCAELVRRVSG